MTRYTFGSDERAAERLKSISTVFNREARKVITPYINGQTPALALDLGCGPGYTTTMLAEVSGADRTCGLDQSAEYIRRASEAFPHLEFIRHDVTVTPFPARPDIIYARFLLSHLTDAVSLINRWLGELAPGGLCFIDEVEKVVTTVPAFQTYLDISDRIVRSGGGSLWIGSLLGQGDYADCEVLYNERDRLPVDDRDAAEWFYPNTVILWPGSELVAQHLSTDEQESIRGELLRLQNSAAGQSNITWYMRRMVLRSAV
ncbi:MAG: class I SAM-dependent methyltransferase [Anaerolineae bacterium]|nr:class I SAM-dependent methyltransferase [Anaerolineae bacterium]